MPELTSAFPYPNFTFTSAKTARHFADVLILEQRRAQYYYSFLIVLKDSKEANWENEIEIGWNSKVQVLPSPSSYCLLYDRPINQCVGTRNSDFIWKAGRPRR